jgi:hypothetical protein
MHLVQVINASNNALLEVKEFPIFVTITYRLC